MPSLNKFDVTDEPQLLTPGGIAMDTVFFFRVDRHSYPDRIMQMMGGGATAPIDWTGALSLYSGEHATEMTMEKLFPGQAFTHLWVRMIGGYGGFYRVTFNHA